MKLVMPQSIKQFLRLSLICLSLLSVTMVQAQSRGLPDFVDLAEKQSPSVVNISTVQNGRGKVTNGFRWIRQTPLLKSSVDFSHSRQGVCSLNSQKTGRLARALLSAQTVMS